MVILTATGRGFCTGHDLRAGGTAAWIPDYVGKAYVSRYSMSVISAIPLALRNLPQPVICGVNGTVAGMALAFPLACDVTIAGSSAKFVNAIHNAGSGAELGLRYLPPRAVGTQPRLLFSSSIAVFGGDLPAVVTDATTPRQRVLVARLDTCAAEVAAAAMKAPAIVAIGSIVGLRAALAPFAIGPDAVEPGSGA